MLHVRRAQLSMELMFAIGLLLFLTVVIIVVIGHRMSAVSSDKDIFLMKDLAFSIKGEIDIAYGVESGYVRVFSVPELLDGKDYSVSMQGNFLVVSLEGKMFSLAVAPVNGSVQKGMNVIRKDEGYVLLN